MFGKKTGLIVRAAGLMAVLVIVVGCTTVPKAQTSTGATAAATEAAPDGSTSGNQTGEISPSLDGAWGGQINVAGQAIDITLTFKGQGGTVDIPAQGARGLRMENFSLQGDQIKFEMLPKPQTATFSGTVQGDKMSGQYEQSGYKGSWSATRQAVSASPTASGAAKAYKEEDVTFKNGDYTLAGTLTLPQGAGPHPAVVLISGSGQQNRDEELFGFKPFAILADAFGNAGIAVLRYDDRGIGGSTTGTAEDTSETYAGDVGAAYDYLKTRDEIDPKQIGLLGHSEGGLIAPIVAVQKGDVAFLVLLAGPGVSGKDLLVQQVGAIAKSGGATEANVAQLEAQQKQVIDAVLSGQGLDQVEADLVAQFKAAAEKLPESQRQQIGDLDAWARQQVQSQIAALQSPWMTFFLTHDPAPVLEKVDAPVLALFGGKDVQVDAVTNEAAIKAALQKGGNQDVTTKVFPDANHLFQSAETGSPTEYATLKPEFAPGVLDTITSWVVAHTK